jgi:PhnB protein
MSVNPYLTFAGNCREVVEYYAGVFNTEKPAIMTFGEMPPDPSFKLPPEAKDLVLHARIRISDTSVMFSDTFPGMKVKVGDNVSLTFISTSRDEILDRWNKLKQGGTVGMDLQQTFWSKLYGDVTDKYGIHWLFSLDSGETFP